MKFIPCDFESVLDTVNRTNPFLREQNLRLTALENGRATALMDADSRVLNIYGMVHGGALFSLADMAAGVCALTSSRHVVTLNSSIQFLCAAQAGELKAVASALHAGSHTGVYEVKIWDHTGTLCAVAEFTMYFYAENKPEIKEQPGSTN